MGAATDLNTLLIGAGMELNMELLGRCEYGGTLLSTRPAQLTSLIPMYTYLEYTYQLIDSKV